MCGWYVVHTDALVLQEGGRHVGPRTPSNQFTGEFYSILFVFYFMKCTITSERPDCLQWKNGTLFQ